MTLNRIALISEMAKQHLTILELSAASTVSISTIGAARCGRSITKNSAKRIAAALGVSVESLMEDKKES